MPRSSGSSTEEQAGERAPSSIAINGRPAASPGELAGAQKVNGSWVCRREKCGITSISTPVDGSSEAKAPGEAVGGAGTTSTTEHVEVPAILLAKTQWDELTESTH